MLAKFPLSSERPAAKPQPPAFPSVEMPGPGVAELIHLARAVLMKNPEDLAAIASAAPAMPRDWIEAFAAERTRAEAEAKFWSAAIAYLMASSGQTAANDT